MHPSRRLVIAAVLVAHMLLALTPAALRWIPLNMSMLPLMWAVAGVTLGQLMLLATWLGMTRGRLAWRLLLSVAGVANLNVWTTLGISLVNPSAENPTRFQLYLGSLWPLIVVLLVLAAVLAVLTRLAGRHSICIQH